LNGLSEFIGIFWVKEASHGSAPNPLAAFLIGMGFRPQAENCQSESH
jgi:hypothetical protein